MHLLSLLFSNRTEESWFDYYDILYFCVVCLPKNRINIPDFVFSKERYIILPVVGVGILLVYTKE